MRKTTLALSALALSLGLALSPLSATAVETSSATTAQQTPSLVPMLGKAMPPVISINVEGSTTVNTPRMPRNFQQFLGDGFPFCQEGSSFQSSPFCQGGLGDNGGGQQQKFMALGSGVIIDVDKDYVVTNNHVVDSTMVVEVQLSDGRRFDAEMVGKDPRSDIALIQIQSPKNLTAVKMTDSDVPRAGDYTVAVGNSFGLGETVTFGIVSMLEHNGLNTENYENSIRADIAVNRGSSGGALVSPSGELIGINTAILASNDGNTGTSFAIPSNMVKDLTSQMMEYSQVKRGELGIMGTEPNSDLAKAMEVDTQCDASVSQILPNSSVVKAGIKAGDMITSPDGKPISGLVALCTRMGTMPVGSKLTLGLLRGGKRVNMNPEFQQSSQNQVGSSTVFNGIEGAEMNNKGKDQGAVANNVKTGTPATQIGLKKDDVIIGTDQQTVENTAEPRKALDSEPSVLVLNVQRGDSTIYLLMQ